MPGSFRRFTAGKASNGASAFCKAHSGDHEGNTQEKVTEPSPSFNPSPHNRAWGWCSDRVTKSHNGRPSRASPPNYFQGPFEWYAPYCKEKKERESGLGTIHQAHNGKGGQGTLEGALSWVRSSAVVCLFQISSRLLRIPLTPIRCRMPGFPACS